MQRIAAWRLVDGGRRGGKGIHRSCKGIVEVMVCNSGGQTHRIIEVFFLKVLFLFLFAKQRREEIEVSLLVFLLGNQHV